MGTVACKIVLYLQVSVVFVIVNKSATDYIRLGLVTSRCLRKIGFLNTNHGHNEVRCRCPEYLMVFGMLNLGKIIGPRN